MSLRDAPSAMRTPISCVRWRRRTDDAVDAHQRQQQSEQAHRAAEQRSHPKQQETVGPFQHPLHGRHIEDRQVRVQHANFPLEGRRQRAGSPAVRS